MEKYKCTKMWRQFISGKIEVAVATPTGLSKLLRLCDEAQLLWCDGAVIIPNVNEYVDIIGRTLFFGVNEMQGLYWSIEGNKQKKIVNAKEFFNGLEEQVDIHTLPYTWDSGWIGATDEDMFVVVGNRLIYRNGGYDEVKDVYLDPNAFHIKYLTTAYSFGHLEQIIEKRKEDSSSYEKYIIYEKPLIEIKNFTKEQIEALLGCKINIIP